MAKERILHINRPHAPLSSFSSRNTQEFSRMSTRHGLEVLRRDLPKVRGLLTSYRPVEEVEIYDGVVYVQKIIKPRTGFGESFLGSRLGETLLKLARRKTAEAST